MEIALEVHTDPEPKVNPRKFRGSLDEVTAGKQQRNVSSTVQTLVERTYVILSQKIQNINRTKFRTDSCYSETENLERQRHHLEKLERTSVTLTLRQKIQNLSGTKFRTDSCYSEPENLEDPAVDKKVDDAYGSGRHVDIVSIELREE